MKKKAVCPVDGCSIGYVEIEENKDNYIVECFRCEEPEHEIHIRDLKDMTKNDYKGLLENLEESIHDESFSILLQMNMTKDMDKLAILDARLDVLQQMLCENHIPSRLEKEK